MFGRVDLAKYKVGLALARNFFVDFRGGVSNRVGTQYVATTTSFGAILLPFVIATTNSYLLEFGQEYINIYQGGTQAVPTFITTVSTPYQLDNLTNSSGVVILKYTQSADVMTLCHPLYPPATLTLTNGSWAYAAITTGTLESKPPSLVAHPPSTTDPDYCYSYVVTAVSLDGKSESLPSNPVLAHYTILDETVGFVIPLTWGNSSTPVSLYRIYKCGPFDDRDSTGAGTIWGYIGSSQTPTFTDLNIAPDFTQTPPMYGDPFSGGQFQSIDVATGGSGYPANGSWTGYIPLTITDSTGTGASGYATTSFAGVVTGAFLTAAGKNYSNSPTITAGSGGATFTFTISPATPVYPAVSSFIQQRQVFTGSNLKPDTMVLSQVGDYVNFNTSPITLDTDAIVIDIASSQVNTVLGLQPVSYGLLAFTSGGCFLVSGGTPGSPITPASITINPQASNGSNDLPPIQINYSVLYMQNKGNIVRDLSFAWQRQSYTGSDISTLANHLFDNFQILQWTWAEAPFKIVWAVRNDGTLLALTYVPDQEVYAWTHHDTQGLFTSVVSIPEGNFNAVYVVAQRFIGGEWVSYIERMASGCDCCINNSFYVDAAVQTVETFPDYTLQLSGTTGTVEITLS